MLGQLETVFGALPRQPSQPSLPASLRLTVLVLDTVLRESKPTSHERHTAFTRRPVRDRHSLLPPWRWSLGRQRDDFPSGLSWRVVLRRHRRRRCRGRICFWRRSNAYTPGRRTSSPSLCRTASNLLGTCYRLDRFRSWCSTIHDEHQWKRQRVLPGRPVEGPDHVRHRRRPIGPVCGRLVVRFDPSLAPPLTRRAYAAQRTSAVRKSKSSVQWTDSGRQHPSRPLDPDRLESTLQRHCGRSKTAVRG